MKVRVFIIGLVLAVIGITGCKTQKQKLEEEARAEATKFWESQVFSKCGGEYGNYFGRQGSKIYEFRSPIVIALRADEEKRQGVDWMGTTPFCRQEFELSRMANGVNGKNLSRWLLELTLRVKELIH